MTPAACAVLEFANSEAAALNHHYLSTEHILLGVMREANSDAEHVLASRTDVATVRACVRETVDVGRDPPRGDLPLTPQAARVLHLARREAKMYGEKHIAPKHLLLGILRGRGHRNPGSTQARHRLGGGSS